MQSHQPQLGLANTDPASAIAEFEQILVSNSGEDPFDSAIKLLAAKLLDEVETVSVRTPKFHIQKTASATHKTVQELYSRAIRRWPHLNGNGESLGISPEHLVRSMRPLIGWHLIDSDLSWLDAALERLVARDAKGILGQYFTPREVIRFCVDVLRPNPKDRIIDPACGSGGFLYESTQYALREFGSAPNCLGIDFGAKAIKVAALLSAAMPQAKLLVSKANSIDGRNCVSPTPMEWAGFLSKAGGAQNKRAKSWGDWNNLTCSLVFTNPPFAGDIDDHEILDAYEAQQNSAAKKTTSREHLFLERAVHLLKPGGRLAIVLPQGLLANSSASYLRQWLFNKCWVLGVVGLHQFAFLPYTSVKTAILFLSKPKADEPIPKDYPIFFAASRVPGKDSSGKVVGANDYSSIAQTFTQFLLSRQFDWAGKKVIYGQADIQSEIVKFSEVKQADRLDAEYYDPSVRALLRRLDNVSEARLANLIDTRVERFKKDQGREVTYLDISSVDSKTGLTFPNTLPADEVPSRASYVVRPGDVLVSTVRPDRNVVALVTGAVGDNAVASNGFCVLRSKTIQPEVLFAYCKTQAFKKILSRHATASMYPTVTDRDVLGVPFLQPPQEVTDRVVHLVRSGLEMIELAHAQISEAISLMNTQVHGAESVEADSNVLKVQQERKPYRRTRKNG